MRGKSRSNSSLSKRGTIVTFTTVTVDSDVFGSQDIERIIRNHVPQQSIQPRGTVATTSRSDITTNAVTESILKSRKEAFNIPEAAALLGTSTSFVANLVNTSRLPRTDSANPKQRLIPKDVLAQFAGDNATMISKHQARVARRKPRKKTSNKRATKA